MHFQCWWQQLLGGGNSELGGDSGQGLQPPSISTAPHLRIHPTHSTRCGMTRCLSLSINFLHVVPIVFAISTASVLVANQNANTNGGICNHPIYELPHCIGYEDGDILEGFEIPCGCSSDGAVQHVLETTIRGMQQPAGGNRESCSKRK